MRTSLYSIHVQCNIIHHSMCETIMKNDITNDLRNAIDDARATLRESHVNTRKIRFYGPDTTCAIIVDELCEKSSFVFDDDMTFIYDVSWAVIAIECYNERAMFAIIAHDQFANMMNV